GPQVRRKAGPYPDSVFAHAWEAAGGGFASTADHALLSGDGMVRRRASMWARAATRCLGIPRARSYSFLFRKPAMLILRLVAVVMLVSMLATCALLPGIDRVGAQELA